MAPKLAQEATVAAAASAAAASTAPPDAENLFLGLPKWVWGALVGGTLVAGLAIYVLTAPPDDDDDNTTGESPTKKAAARKKKKATESSKATSGSSSSRASPAPLRKSGNAAEVKVEDVPESEEVAKDPFEKAMAFKNRGNKYFQGGRYELAIKCYTSAIETCPSSKTSDLATFYQNRAAACELLGKHDQVLADCSEAIKLNDKYVKALDRRARIIKKINEESGDSAKQDPAAVVEQLKVAAEDMTAVCLLEGFTKPAHLVMVDSIIKDLGKAEAKIICSSKRKKELPSKHYIRQYFTSFYEDPLSKDVGLAKDPKSQSSPSENGDHSSHPHNHDDLSNGGGDNGPPARGYRRAVECFSKGLYEEVEEACTEELVDPSDAVKHKALLLRATFRSLAKKYPEAIGDLTDLIEDDSADVKVRANALVKRASLYIHMCQDPHLDQEKSFSDLSRALEIDPSNVDVYFHRGQVNLLTDNSAKAVADFDRALEINPDFSLAHVQRLFTKYRKAVETEDGGGVKLTQVMAEFQEAIKTFPDCVETVSLYAQVLGEQGKLKEASEYYEMASSREPGNANLLVHRGLVALQLNGDVEKARNLIQKAIALDSKCGLAYETMATLEVQTGNTAGSVKYFNDAIQWANTELEVAHLCGMKAAAEAQNVVSKRLGIVLPHMMM